MQVRMLEISNFRGVNSLAWFPHPKFNCIIGPGDSGKSTILDALDLCLAARHTLQFNDSDFHQLDASEPIVIQATIGNLSPAFLGVESYADFIRGFSSETKEVHDEPEANDEHVITIQLKVTPDLDSEWSLYSDRAAEADTLGRIRWPERQSLAPLVLSHATGFHLSWRKGAAFSRLVDDGAVNVAEALASAARDARQSFGDAAREDLEDALQLVVDAGQELGVPVGNEVNAYLDPGSVTFRSGAVSLHGEGGVPLRALGLGSGRLLTAGLQRQGSAQAPIVLVDEVEAGLEPHRIRRLLSALGAKDAETTIQVFCTSHSPVVLQELSDQQIYRIRPSGDELVIDGLGGQGLQGTLRATPSAFLAQSVIVCEGLTEQGFIRALDSQRSSPGRASFDALGAVTASAGGDGGLVTKVAGFRSIGLPTAAFCDSDGDEPEEKKKAMEAEGAAVFQWTGNASIEGALFRDLPSNGIKELLNVAIDTVGKNRVEENLTSAFGRHYSLEDARTACQDETLNADTRQKFAVASQTGSKPRGWFKRISWMENAASRAVFPYLDDAEQPLQRMVESINAWVDAQ